MAEFDIVRARKIAASALVAADSVVVTRDSLRSAGGEMARVPVSAFVLAGGAAQAAGAAYADAAVAVETARATAAEALKQDATADWTNGLPLAVQRALTMRTGERATLKDFGAKGDSTQDDSSYIQNALTTMGAIGASLGTACPIEAPFGIYKIGTKVSIPSLTGIVGITGGISYNGGYQPNFQPYGANIGTLDYLFETPVGARGCVFEKCGLYLGTQLYRGGGLLWRSSDGFISRVTIDRAFLTALYVDTAPRTIIEHCFLRGHYVRPDATTRPTLSGVTGAGLHHYHSEDGRVFDTEIAGDSAAPLDANLYSCAAYSDAGYTQRWVSNIFETADVGFYQAGSGNLSNGNRYEYNRGHGRWQIGGTKDNTSHGEHYNNNGLGQDDRFYHLYNQGGNNNHHGAHFEMDGHASSVLTILPALCVHDAVTATPVNKYSALTTDDNVRSARYYAHHSTEPHTRANLYDAFYPGKHFAAAPASGWTEKISYFAQGDEFTAGVFGTAQLYRRAFSSGGSYPSVGGARTTGTADGTTTATVVDGTKVQVGANLTINAQGPQRVLHKNGNTLTLSGAIAAGTGNVFYTGGTIRPANFRVPTTASGTSFTPDLSVGDYFQYTATGAATIAAPTNAAVGTEFVVDIVQDGTGGRAVTWNSAFKFSTAWSDAGDTAGKRSQTRWMCVASSVYLQIGTQTPYV